MNYYELLGLEATATKPEIKARYKKLALKYHPDISQEHNSEELFKKIAHAASVLLDDEKKKEYDRELKQEGSTSRKRGRTAEESYNEGLHYRAHRKNKSYDFTTASSIGENIEIKVIISLEEMLKGRITADIPIIKGCGYCHGIGLDYKGRLCQSCMGTGFVFGTQEVGLDISGYYGGDKICLDGHGHISDTGGKKGNLFILLEEKPHPYYTRDGHNIVTEYNVPYFDYILGTSFDLQYFQKVIPITIPANYDKPTVVIRGAGLPYYNKKELLHGDLIVKLNITVPFLPDELKDKRDEMILKLAKLYKKKEKK